MILESGKKYRVKVNLTNPHDLNEHVIPTGSIVEVWSMTEEVDPKHFRILFEDDSYSMSNPDLLEEL